MSSNVLELFGSDSEEDSRSPRQGTSEGWWKPAEKPLAGLSIVRDFLSQGDQEEYVRRMYTDGLFMEVGADQSMRFGILPHWAEELAEVVHECATQQNLLASHILERKPFFNQTICNRYKKGQGIAKHVDLLKFADGIAIISFIGPCDMQFYDVSNESNCLSVVLYPGDLLLMEGPARYDWKHGIKEIAADERISITLRAMNVVSSDDCIDA